jgi:hypothetical protein
MIFHHFLDYLRLNFNDFYIGVAFNAAFGIFFVSEIIRVQDISDTSNKIKAIKLFLD